MLRLSRNSAFAVVGLLLIWGFYLGSYMDSGHSVASTSIFGFQSNKSPLSPHIQTFFDQAFSAETAPDYDFPGLKASCARAEWKQQNRDVYLQCGGMSAGMTSIISQVKVCFKMAVDAGVNMILPAMPLRDSDDLTQFNFWNSSAYMTYDDWFDQEHLLASIARVCPQMKIRHPDEVDTLSLPVTHHWDIDIASAPGFQHLNGYFWVGRPFKDWFDLELQRLRFFDFMARKKEQEDAGQDIQQQQQQQPEGATIIGIASQFLLFRVTDDATGRELALWNDLSHLIRFKETPRFVTNRVLSLLNRPYFGVHFRTEKDNIWSSFENQLQVDLDSLDKVWDRYASTYREKPLIYLACGDESQIERFSEAAVQRGWTVTSKYDILKDYPVALKRLTDMPFDFQGAVDMGIMMKSHFFLGITGSAFSCTVANLRDSTGRYRGSSIAYPEDGNARTHLSNDGDATHYPCCL